MSEIRTMENERLLVAVSDHGAELCRIYDKKNRREVLWNADPAFWNRHAPILFPFVGKVRGGCYRHEGRTYEMKTQHGFARDMDFTCTEETPAAVTHRLCASAQTLEVYPFAFVLTVTHRMEGNTLRVEWQV